MMTRQTTISDIDNVISILQSIYEGFTKEMFTYLFPQNPDHYSEFKNFGLQSLIRQQEIIIPMLQWGDEGLSTTELESIKTTILTLDKIVSLNYSTNDSLRSKW